MNSAASPAPLGWLGIVRMGLVQTALGAIVVLTTSTMNRIMVVELALPAVLPGALVAFHYALQLLRPRWGYGSDLGGRRTPWILAGMAVLATGGFLASLATAWMASNMTGGLILAVVAFALIGFGVGAAGTSLLALLASRVAPARRGAAATIVWMMMIAGFVVTAITSGHFLDPFSPLRLVAVTGVVSLVAFVLAVVALWNVEGPARSVPLAAGRDAAGTPTPTFADALAAIWAEPVARRFTVFVFLSMLAYSMQDLILEPFAGIVFNMTPGETTRLAGVQHGGVFAGMALVAVAGSAGLGFGTLRGWTIGGCFASCAALLAIASSGLVGPAFPLKLAVFLLGAANGAFAVAAIGSMMQLAGSGEPSREGLRLGLWGASQAIAFAAGGFVGAAGADLLRAAGFDPVVAFTTIFALEAGLFVYAAKLAAGAIAPVGNATMRPVRDEAMMTDGAAAPQAGR